MVVFLIAVSLSAFAFAAWVAFEALAERAARKDRIARATRPVHGRPIVREVTIARNRLGED